MGVVQRAMKDVAMMEEEVGLRGCEGASGGAVCVRGQDE